MTRLRWPFGTFTWATAAILAIALLLPVAASGAAANLIGSFYLLPAAASSAPASRVANFYLFGANMPWLHWNADFGGGPFGGGVSGNQTEVNAKLQSAHNAGMHILRWWVLEGGSPQVQRDASGTPTGLNPNLYTDLDAALALAAKYDISFNFVLFGSTNDDATSHQWWENSTKRQALVRVLTPLFQRYAANPHVHTWEIVNEPEWQSRNGITSQAGMLATGDALANAIHQNSHALVTVGNAQLQDMQTWVGHPLDYYSPHYYDNFGGGSNDPFLNQASSPDGKPVVIGEFPASTGLTPDAATRLQALYAKGYAGSWNWSWSPEHSGDGLATDINAATAFSQGKTDLGPQLSGAPTATPVPVTATAIPPTATSVPPTATAVPKTATPIPPTATSVPKTVTPTQVPPTAVPGPVSQTVWTLHSTPGASSVARGSSVRLSTNVTANHTTSALVDVEVYDANWNKVYQRFWDSQAFTLNQARTFSASWTVPVSAGTGTYHVMVGTFGPGWNGVYKFNGSAATFTVR